MVHRIIHACYNNLAFDEAEVEHDEPVRVWPRGGAPDAVEDALSVYPLGLQLQHQHFDLWPMCMLVPERRREQLLRDAISWNASPIDHYSAFLGATRKVRSAVVPNATTAFLWPVSELSFGGIPGSWWLTATRGDAVFWREIAIGCNGGYPFVEHTTDDFLYMTIPLGGFYPLHERAALFDGARALVFSGPAGSRTTKHGYCAYSRTPGGAVNVLFFSRRFVEERYASAGDELGRIAWLRAELRKGYDFSLDDVRHYAPDAWNDYFNGRVSCFMAMMSGGVMPLATIPALASRLDDGDVLPVSDEIVGAVEQLEP